MAEIARLSMEIIAEESSRMLSDRNLRDCDASSFELLLRAHDRIRTLEAENEELLSELRRRAKEDEGRAALIEEVTRLASSLRERDLKIQNLQRINEKAIHDYVLVEKQLAALQSEGRNRLHTTPIPAELNSPLTLSRIHPHSPDTAEHPPFDCPKRKPAEQERLQLNRTEQKWKELQIFTFDKENGRREKSPKVLKNCFSELEVNQLISKVQGRGHHKHCGSKQRLQHYHNYCSSIERKHSPNTAARKPAFPAPTPLKRPLVLKSPSYSKGQGGFGEKGWAETASSAGTAPSFGCAEGSLRKLHFY